MITKFKLFENPNTINIDDENVEWWSSRNAYAFAYYHNKKELNIKHHGVHSTMYDNLFGLDTIKTPKGLDPYDYQATKYRTPLSGRLFTDYKIITFWLFPKNQNELKKVIKDLESQLKIKIWDDPQYEIEINTHEWDNEDWGNENPSEDYNIKNISLKDYKSSLPRGESELSKQHELSPLNKQKRKVYQKKPIPLDQKIKMYAESFKEEDSYDGIEDFIIPKNLRKNTKISNRNLAFVRDWETKIMVCNSCAKDNKVGDWDGVGYTMINYKTNEIIPIARADEHHTGYDLMWDYKEQGIIERPNDWISIFWSNNYLFGQLDEKDAVKTATAFEKWLSYGGKNTNLLVTMEQKRLEMDLQTFVDLKGNYVGIKEFIQKEGELTEIADDFIKNLEYITFYFQRYHKGEETAKDTCDYVKKYLILKGINTFMNSLYYKTNITKACNRFDVKKVEELIFSHNGLKNTIHNKLRHEQENPELKKYFGNIKVALNKFDIISNI